MHDARRIVMKQIIENLNSDGLWVNEKYLTTSGDLH
jgi:hypothetical protein